VAYAPIEDYGVIGNLHTVALVGKDGAIDWWCAPRFDSPSLFGALLDDVRGGRCHIAPVPDGIQHRQFYFPDTNVLITRFMSPDGVVEITDFMPVGPDAGNAPTIVRRVEAVRGTMRLTFRCEPAFDYARATHHVTRSAQGVLFTSDGATLALTSATPLEIDGGAAIAEFTVRQGEQRTFVLVATASDGAHAHPGDAEIDAAFRETVAYWHGWLARCTYRGRWREIVHRSALLLKLLTYAPTGAIVAAPTMSLPEAVGGPRNWDYRYTWIRDASFTLYALVRIGFLDEARAFTVWLHERIQGAAEETPLQVMYGIDGRRDLTETTLDHLEGYRGSRPVRLGNAAHTQPQHDIYGELLDAIYLFNKYGTPTAHHEWMNLRRLLDRVCQVWQEPDAGIWEVRSDLRHFVHSKVMCWVALDRGLRLADKRAFPAPRDAWRAARDAIYEDVMARGWNEDAGAFVQAYDRSALDASSLILPIVLFVAQRDPRLRSTVDAIRRTLTAGSLVHRYLAHDAPDGLSGAEGTFTMCSFWLVEALTRMGDLDEARLTFERMLSYANHLGLYAEQIGASGEALGNFPQAFTHLSLITAAVNLDRALDQRR